MFAALTEPLDRLAIRMACTSVPREAQPCRNLDLLRAFIERADFFPKEAVRPQDLQFTSDKAFTFSSPIPSLWPINNVVHGKFFRADEQWRDCPTTILIHGWNSETAYYRMFPWLARRFNARGINALMFELPFHGQRKPRQNGAQNNFISNEAIQTLEATRQAVAEIRAVLAWLKSESSRPAGLWGVSLGAWLSGLALCMDAHFDFGVLLTPVVRMDRVVAELEFCAPLKTNLEGTRVSFEPFNLYSLQPRIPPERLLFIASQFDLFAPPETIEECWRAWNKPEIWWVRHGHISVLLSVPVLLRSVRWVAQKM
jgi:dienelactone hydrolase